MEVHPVTMNWLACLKYECTGKAFALNPVTEYQRLLVVATA